MDDIFELVNGQLTIKRKAVLFHPLIKTIIRRDKGGVIVGDPDGRNKALALREIYYGWWVINVNSPGVMKALKGAELMKNAIDNLDLPSNWEPDTLVTEWVKAYKEIHEGSVIVRSIKQIIATIDNMSKLHDRVIEHFETQVDTMTLDQTNEYIKFQSTISSNAASLPKMLKDLKALYIDIRNEEKQVTIAKGGIKVSSSMVPDNEE